MPKAKSMKIDREIPSSVGELAAVLSQPEARRGSVSERTMKSVKRAALADMIPKARAWPLLHFDPTAGGQNPVLVSS
jgi:hypothetical protein